MGIEYTFNAPKVERLDKLIAEELERSPRYKGLSRSQIKLLIEGGQCKVEGKETLKAGTLVKTDALICIILVDPSPLALTPYDFELEVKYEDKDLIVVDKPSGLSMHPGAGNKTKTLVNALLSYFQKQKDVPEVLTKDASISGATIHRPGVVHRLDKDTTGLVVVAKTVRAHAALSKQFAERSVGRRYLALVFSTPRGKRLVNLSEYGVIDSRLTRHPVKRKEMSVVKDRGKDKGKRAVTHWRLLERCKVGSLLELRLETGRTHQIRIHLSHIGSPVIGDRTYGDFSGLPKPLKKLHEDFGRQALHACYLEFSHPSTSERLTFVSEIPRDMRELFEAFKSYNK